MEEQFRELQATLQDTEHRLKISQSHLETVTSDSIGLREELHRLDRELREVRHAENILRDDINVGRSSQSDFENRLESSSRLIAQILDVALTLRASCYKAMQSATAATAHPPSSKNQSTQHGNGDSMILSGIRSSMHQAPPYLDEPLPIDPSDPAAALEILREFNHDLFLEIIGKTGSTIKKWQKQCKEYRERAKGKITFRNFAKADLALFLPTRNSVSKPWAAFNGGVLQ